MAPESAAKKDRVQGRISGECCSSEVPEIKNENVLMNNNLVDAMDPVGNTHIAFLEGAQRKYCRMLQYSFRKFPDHDEQCGYDIKMKLDLVLAEPP